MHTAAVRRLTHDEYLGFEFATTWPEYDLDEPTKALLGYASKLTEMPSMIEAADVDRLRTAGWDDDAVWEITALVSFFNFSGRMEAASGLPPDEIPQDAKMRESQA
jgi:uncharacterized peroxidase-related enzyme